MSSGSSELDAGAGRPRPSRDLSIDLLRMIAILEVILAHVALPPWLAQARNFGVPLLILLSGWSIGLSLRDRKPTFTAYFLHRLKRVALPAWGFLAFYFVTFAITDAFGLTTAGHDAARILDSFLFGLGIGYVWVIRINLLLALVTLPLVRLSRTIASDRVYLGLILVAVVVNELLFLAYATAGGRSGLGAFLATTPFYMVGYGAIFALGMRLPQLSPRMVTVAWACSASAFLLLAGLLAATRGDFVPTQGFKYPPQIYYVAYALAVSLLLVQARHALVRLLPGGRAEAAVAFIGSHTLPIYLWHILALQLVNGATARGLLPDHTLAAFVAVATLSIGAAWLQSITAHRISSAISGARAERSLARPG